jgi:cell wall-associated NlpC family hydrolase
VDPTRVHRPLRIQLRVLVVGVVATLLVGVLPVDAAHAGPTVAQIEAQIAQIWQQAEPMVEKYNSIHDQYLKNKAQQGALERKIAPLRMQVELGQIRVGFLAAEAYRGQGADTFNALISAGSPGVFADQLMFLDVMAREQERQVSGVAALQQKYDAQKAPIDALVSKLAQQDADLAKQKTAILAKIDQLQRLRLQAYGASGATGSYRPWPCPSQYAPTNGYKAALFACKQAGKPYVWAAAGPSSYDCSGLTLAAWASIGVYLPHNALSQRLSIPSVSRTNLQVGDLVFYYSDTHHVAIYEGNDKVMQAPAPGDNVRMTVMEEVGPISGYGRPR